MNKDWKDYANIKKIVAIGRLHHQKNFKFLIDSFGDVYKRHGGLKLQIWGEGNARDELQNYINEKSLDNVVFLEVRTTNVIDVLKEADLFILSSNFVISFLQYYFL